jgi:hypothetical protein
VNVQSNPVAPSSIRRSRIRRGVALLAVGYVAAGALLIRDYIVQGRSVPGAVTAVRSSAPMSEFAAR